MFKNKNEENSTLFFSVPEEKKNILNDKSSSITESSIDYIPNKRKKISEEDNFYSLSMKEPKLSKQKKITFNIKPEIIKKEEKKDNENLLFSVPKNKKENISSTTEIISSSSPILNNIKDEKIKIDIKSIPVSVTIDINKQTDIELFNNKNNFSLFNHNPFIMKAKNVKIEQKFTVPQNSLFENYNESKEIKVYFNNDNLNEKKR